MSTETIITKTTKTLESIVSEPEPELPKRTPKWFKEYMNLNTIGRTIGLSIFAAFVTGLSGFGGFPQTPVLFKQLYEKFPSIRWLILFLLIWQGGGGATFTTKAFFLSIITTLIIFLIYQIPFVKYGWYLNEIPTDNERSNQVIVKKNKDEDEVEVEEQIIKTSFKKKKFIPKTPKQELVNLYNEKELSVIDIETSHGQELQKFIDSLDNEMTKTIELKESTPNYDQEWKTLPKVKGNYYKKQYNSLNINAIENNDLVSEKPENLYADNTPYQQYNNFWNKQEQN